MSNRVHEALCKWSGQSVVFTGSDASRTSPTGHLHAQIFCEANGRRDAITHLTVFANDGFDETASVALRRLNKIWGHGGHDLRLVLIGLGQPDAFPECRIFTEAKVWRSATPFVSTRHGKSFKDGRPKMDDDGWQIGSAPNDLLRLLRLDPKTQSATIRKEVGLRAGERSLRCVQFQTIRHDGGGSRGNGDAGAFTITFKSKVAGPIALGYGAHFGLGLFVPAGEGEVI